VNRVSLKELTLSYIDTKKQHLRRLANNSGLARLEWDGFGGLPVNKNNQGQRNQKSHYLKEWWSNPIFLSNWIAIRISNTEDIYRDLLPGNAEPGLLKFDQVSAEVF